MLDAKTKYKYYYLLIKWWVCTLDDLKKMSDYELESIGSINNLEFIPWEENLTKRCECSITLDKII